MPNHKFSRAIALLAIVICSLTSAAQSNLDSILPIRGFSIGSPSPGNLDSFVRFINQELAPRKVNTLLLRVDYNYQYKSHPELRGASTLTEADVKKTRGCLPETWHTHYTADQFIGASIMGITIRQTVGGLSTI